VRLRELTVSSAVNRSSNVLGVGLDCVPGDIRVKLFLRPATFPFAGSSESATMSESNFFSEL
jgi:hypothetical protein